MTNNNETDAELTRKGSRRNAGADTPSGPNTNAAPNPPSARTAARTPTTSCPALTRTRCVR